MDFRPFLLVPVLTLLGCGAQPSSPVDMSRLHLQGSTPFAALYESREGSQVSTTEVLHTGSGYILRKTSTGLALRCSNLTGTATCRSGTGMLLPADETEKILRMEETSMDRLLQGQRVLVGDTGLKQLSVPQGMRSFGVEAFSASLRPYLTPASLALEGCREQTQEELTEFTCSGGGRMPFWSTTTRTDIGAIKISRLLKALATPKIAPEDLERIAQEF